MDEACGRNSLSRTLRLILVVLTAAVASGAARASDNPAVDDFVGRINATIGSLKSGDTAGARAACRRLVEQAFDIDAMAPMTSAGAWQRMNKAQKAIYRDGVAGKAERDCASHSRDYAGQAMQLVGVRQGDGGDLFVAVKGKRQTLIWQVRGGARLRAVDVSVNGRSLVIGAQRQAKAILQKSGDNLQALIDSVAD